MKNDLSIYEIIYFLNIITNVYCEHEINNFQMSQLIIFLSVYLKRSPCHLVHVVIHNYVSKLGS
jgi:hypothetical protein